MRSTTRAIATSADTLRRHEHDPKSPVLVPLSSCWPGGPGRLSRAVSRPVGAAAAPRDATVEPRPAARAAGSPPRRRARRGPHARPSRLARLRRAGGARGGRASRDRVRTVVPAPGPAAAPAPPATGRPAHHGAVPTTATTAERPRGDDDHDGHGRRRRPRGRRRRRPQRRRRADDHDDHDGCRVHRSGQPRQSRPRSVSPAHARCTTRRPPSAVRGAADRAAARGGRTPGDVEAEPGRPGACAAGVGRGPRAGVGRPRAAPVAGVRTAGPRSRPASGVWAKTLSTRTSTTSARSSARQRHRRGASGRPRPRSGGPGPRRAHARTPSARRTTARRRTLGAGRAHRAAGPRARSRRWCAGARRCAPRSRRASSGSSTASASRRSAVTGVRSRWREVGDRGPLGASSSLVRSASPLSARASSCGLLGAARPPRAPSGRPRAAGARRSATVAQRLADPPAELRGDAPPPAPAARAPSPMMPAQARARRGAGPPAVTLVRTTAVPSRDDHRQQHPAAVVVDDGERLAAAARAAPRVVGRARRSRRSPGRRRCSTAVGRRRGCRGLDDSRSSVRRRAGRRPGSPTLRASWSAAGHRPVLGQRAHQQAQRDHEGHDDRRRRGEHQP